MDESNKQPNNLADLRLPPTFVADHCIRTLASQGAMTLVELAKHWRVPSDVAAQVLEPPKAAGLIETETNRSNLETLQKWRLSGSGHARVETARARTWYAGPLPVSLAEYERRVGTPAAPPAARDRLRAALTTFHLAPAQTDALAQAVSAGASVAAAGFAPDEQYAVAAALHRSLEGDVEVPQAIFAAGAVMRVFDARVHPASDGSQDSGAADVLRTRAQTTQWSRVPRPFVAVAGGVSTSDVIPPFDEDARFYVAPAPLVAAGGLLAVCDAASSDVAALDLLARYWMAPARRGGGVLLLRTGERIEIPWSAALVLFGAVDELPSSAATAVQYTIDVSPIAGAALRSFLAARLGGFAGDAVEAVASVVERTDLATRTAAASVTHYLAECRTYLGNEFAFSDQVLSAALQHAARRQRPMLRQAA